MKANERTALRIIAQALVLLLRVTIFRQYYDLKFLAPQDFAAELDKARENCESMVNAANALPLN